MSAAQRSVSQNATFMIASQLGTSSCVTGWGEMSHRTTELAEPSMESDLSDLVRICRVHAQAAQAPKVAAALLRLAKHYQRRAAQLSEGKQERGGRLTTRLAISIWPSVRLKQPPRAELDHALPRLARSMIFLAMRCACADRSCCEDAKRLAGATINQSLGNN